MTGSTKFELGEVEHNEAGWGPVTLPADLSDVPYAPFSKGDKLGRVADFTNQFSSARAERVYGTGMTNQTFNLFQQDESFQVVDNTKAKSVSTWFNKGTRQQQPFKRDAKAALTQRNYQKLGSTKPKQNKTRTFRRNQNWSTAGKIRDPSVETKPEWKLLEEIDFNRLTKMSYEIPSATDIKICGTLKFYDKTFDRITPKNERPFQSVTTVHPRVNTISDPVIQQLAKDNEGNVFGTDTILALLMAAPRSIYPWDIVINRVGDKLYFDKRDESKIDLFTVNETSPDAPSDAEGFNSPDSLALEATYVNQSFIEQVLGKATEKHSFPEPSPFTPEEAPAHKAYRYRKFKLDEKNTVVLRTEMDAITKVGNSNVNISLKTLLEYDPKISTSWRNKLDSQRGALLAAEIKANSNKLTRWTAEALLSGVDHIKLGFISRVNPKDPLKHSTLATQVFKPNEFANQINFSFANAWGIIKSIVDYCMPLPEGKYLMVKDPNKTMMRLFHIPANSFKEMKIDEDAEDDIEQQGAVNEEEFDE